MTPRSSYSTYVATAEAAFIANLTDRDMNRVVDEHILPESLFRIEDGRCFARLGAALTSLYFRTENILVAEMRRRILTSLTDRLLTRPDREEIFALLPSMRNKHLDWHFKLEIGEVDFKFFIDTAWMRVRTIENAESLIATDPDILGGIPVFAGTRVPIEMVLASVEKGVDAERIQKSYPFLTSEHIEAARVHTSVRPRRGRPALSSRAPSHWKVQSRRTIRPANT